MRDNVRRLVQFGRMPNENAAVVSKVEEYEQMLSSLATPLTLDEAESLLDVFPEEGSCFGLAWTLLHMIESAPDWRESQVLSNKAGPWPDRLRQRMKNAK